MVCSGMHGQRASQDAGACEVVTPEARAGADGEGEHGGRGRRRTSRTASSAVDSGGLAGLPAVARRRHTLATWNDIAQLGACKPRERASPSTRRDSRGATP